jgi:hypothetical protein
MASLSLAGPLQGAHGASLLGHSVGWPWRPPAISSPWRDASAPFLHGQRPCSYLQPLLAVLSGARRLFDEMSSCCCRAPCPSPRSCSLDVVVEPSLLWLPPKDSAPSPSQHRRRSPVVCCFYAAPTSTSFTPGVATTILV